MLDLRWAARPELLAWPYAYFDQRQNPPYGLGDDGPGVGRDPLFGLIPLAHVGYLVW